MSNFAAREALAADWPDWELVVLDGHPHARSTDPETANEAHLVWDMVAQEWVMGDGPLPQRSRPVVYWWRRVRTHAFRYGVPTPADPPPVAVSRYERDMASGWYAQHHLEADLGIPREQWRIPRIEP